MPQNTSDGAAAALASRQGGVLTRAQAMECGLSPSKIRTRIRAGLWERLGTSVYGVAGAPHTWEQRVWAACLETGGLASHRTAGWLWGLDGLGRTPPGELEVIVSFANRRTTDGAQVRRSRTLVPAHAAKRPGIPRTNLARTLLDLSEVLGPLELELAFDSALRQQADLRAWLNRLLRPLSARGHQGIGNLKELLSEPTPAADSALEVKLRRLLKAAKLPAPRTGVDVIDGGVHVAKLDFAWPDNRPRVALMAHGARWHGNTRRWQRDLQQVSQLAGLGWRVVQCSLEDLQQRPEELLLNLRRALDGFEAKAKVGAMVEH